MELQGGVFLWGDFATEVAVDVDAGAAELEAAHFP